MRWRLVFGLAFRNLFRNKRRNLVSSVAIIAGVTTLILGDGLVTGIDESVLRSQERIFSGQVLLRPIEYPTNSRNFPLALAQPLTATMHQRLQSSHVESWTARLFFRARLIHRSDSLRVKVIGYDPNREPTVFQQERWITQGHWPRSQNQIAIGIGLSDLLQLQIGDNIVLEARSRPGAINAVSAQIVGVTKTYNAAADSFTVWMPIEAADSFVLANGARSHIAILSSNGRSNVKELSSTLATDNWQAYTAADEVHDLLEVNKFRRRAYTILTAILMAIAAVGIANTVIMSAYERIAEVGTLRSLGMRRKEILVLFIGEGALMGLFAGWIGVFFGGFCNYILSQRGIDLSNQVGAFGEIPFPTQLFSHFSMSFMLWSLLFGVATSLLASLWPATHAVHIQPADAVRRK